MQIDKRNGKCLYNDVNHCYWDEDTNEKYISVTTLIGKFEAEFDKEFWSKYKAVERILDSEIFKLAKKQLLNTHKFTQSFLESFNIDEKELMSVQQDILDEWEKKNKDSCVRGSKIHAELESYAKGGKFKSKILPKLNYPIDNYKCYVDPDKNELIKSIDQGILPEYLVYRESPDGILKIAGQIDLLIKNGNDIYIVDYKTNEEIKQKSGFSTTTKRNAMMKYPLNNLMDCNYIHYTLQLSTYAWILQKINPEYKIKGLTLIHFDHKDNITTYQLDYLKDDVERMLAYYKTVRRAELEVEKRKRIEF